MNEFIIGALSSLAAAFLIYISRSIWDKWFNLLLSNNYPNVRGKYRVEEVIHKNHLSPWYPEEKQILKIRQFGKKVYGSFNIYDGDALKHSRSCFR